MTPDYIDEKTDWGLGLTHTHKEKVLRSPFLLELGRRQTGVGSGGNSEYDTV